MDDPFPDGTPLAAMGEMMHAILSPKIPPGPPYVHVVTSDRVEWRRCKCPWWHRLPLVSRFVHSELP